MAFEFKNEPLTDFSQPQNVKAFEDALAKVSSELGKEYDLIIGGKRKKTQDRICSLDPCDPKTVIGYTAKATSEDAEEAIGVATEAFESWKFVEPAQRAEYLFKAAARLRGKSSDIFIHQVIGSV